MGNGVILSHCGLSCGMARLFHTTTDDILGLTTEEQISLRGMTEQEKRLVYNLIDYISERNKP